MHKKTGQASPEPGTLPLGQTIPALIDMGCHQTPNPHAFNYWTESGWRSLSNQDFRTAVESVALGFLELGLERGDRVAFLMHSDIHFCMVDMGCLLANLVDVPIDLTQTIEHILFVLRHTETKVFVVSNLDLLTQLVPYLPDAPDLQFIVVADVPTDWQTRRQEWNTTLLSAATLKEVPIPADACLEVPGVLNPGHTAPAHPAVPASIQVISLAELQAKPSQPSPEKLQQCRATLTPDTLATLIYIPDEEGQMQGVMLTHENLSANALSSFSAITDLKRGNQETVLTFLPLNHVLARSMLYGHISYGHSIYFSSPNRVIKHLKEVQPTILVTVPLFLEKIYHKILEKGSKPQKTAALRDPELHISDAHTSPLLLLSGAIATRFRLSLALLQSLQVVFTQFLFNWSLSLAQRYELGRSPKGLYRLLLKLADWLVFCKWREVFGGRLTHLICGGAALPAEIANVFAAAGVPILNGYGLTQASAVVCCNRSSLNRAGTVGLPIPGVQVAIAPDGEILVRGPYVTPGYYKNAIATQALIDAQGWLHTGDLGDFTAEGCLRITGLKKSLFKLSTGKYIVPQPIEQRIMQSPLIAQAVVVGSERKYCAMLIVPNMAVLHHHAQTIGFDQPDEALLNHPCTLALYQSLVDGANCRLPYWGLVKRFQLINLPFTVENGLLNAAGQINRAFVLKVFASEIDALYHEEATRKVPGAIASDLDQSSVACPAIAVATCPAYAQSLNPRLTT